MFKYVIALVVALVLNASANLMIKFGMRSIDMQLAGGGVGSLDAAGMVRLLLKNWVLLAGLGCFAANVVFYAYALQKMPISIAYPIMVASGFALIVVVAGAMLGERLTPVQWVGVLGILIGVALVAKDAGRQMGTGSRAETPPTAAAP
jgi:multidrug transporter EmrE-like cation transporter